MLPPKMSRLILYSILFLFFFQLIADFVESTYAFGLLGTALPVEAVSVLLLLSPVILLLPRKRLPGWSLVLLGQLMLASRIVEPLLGTRGRMIVAGLGVACFMLLFPALLTRPEEAESQGRGLVLGLGLTLGLSMSILFRALYSGSDLSTQGWFQAIGWLLAAGAAVLMMAIGKAGGPAGSVARSPLSSGGQEAPPAAVQTDQPGFWRVVGLSLGLISVLILLYFSFTAPNVIARWTGVGYLLILPAIMLVLSVFALFLAPIPRLFSGLTPRVVVLWNVLFVLFLVLTLLGPQIAFPAEPGAYPYPEPAGTLLQPIALFVMLMLFPVIIVDFMVLAQDLAYRSPSPRAVGGAFALAALFFLFMILAQIFTTVYDYIPVVGPLFRDRFWLVFLIPGCVLILAVLLADPRSFRLERISGGARTGPVFAGLIVAIGLVAVAGAFGRAAKPPLPSGMSTVRILTYNIRQGFSRDGLKNYDGQLDLLRQVDADVIGLQESDTNRIAGGNADVVRYFADGLDMHSYYGPKTVVGTFGIALLSKYPIQNPRTFYMYSEGEQTATIEAQIVVGDATFNVFVTHLGNGGPLVQQQAILREVEGQENVVLMGDFNFRPDTDQYRLTTTLLDDSWLLRWPQGTEAQGVDPTQRIDHIFVSPGTRVADSQYLDSPASDHPVMTTVIEW